MKITILTFLFGLLCQFSLAVDDSFTCHTAGSTADSLQLVDFYNATSGLNWNLAHPISSWDGVALDGAGNVTYLHLANSGLQGNLIDFNLPNLTYFNCDNNQLTGNIPDFSNLINLNHFYCAGNQLTGNIPDFSNLTYLIYFHCNNNELTDSIPDFSNLIHLTYFNCDNNELTGSIPDFSNSPNLAYFYCNNNQLTGSIPNFSNLPGLTFFRSSHNQLTGNIPNLSNFSNLASFRCQSNELTGSIPELSNLFNLTDFWCQSNELTGSIPDLSNLTNLTDFNCSNNKLTDSIPDLSNLSNLTNFDCQNNELTGSIPNLSNLSNLTDFDCGNNQLTGTIPNLSNLSNLTSFSCKENQLTGTIPDLSNLSNLTNFDCQNNELTSSIPNLSNLPNLTDFYCQNNQLTGSIPDLSNILNLTSFYCFNNQLTFTSFIPTYQNNAGIPHFYFSPQTPNILPDQYYEINESDTLLIDLGIDETLNTNVYTWYKDDIPIDTIMGNNKLLIPYALSEDSGTYRCDITNTIISELTLPTGNISVNVVVCPSYNTDSLCYEIIPNELIIDLASHPYTSNCDSMHMAVIDYLEADSNNIYNYTLDSCNCGCLLKITFDSDSIVQTIGIHERKKGMQSSLDVDTEYEYTYDSPNNDTLYGTGSIPYYISGNQATVPGESITIMLTDSGFDTLKVLGPFAQSESQQCSNNYDPNVLSYLPPMAEDSLGLFSPFQDDILHGSYMSGIIQAMSPNASKIGMAKVFSQNGHGTKFNWICSIHHAVNHNKEVEEQISMLPSPPPQDMQRRKIRIINSSLGWTGGTSSNSIALKAIIAADSQDIIIVVSAGNDGMDLDVSPHVFPACFDQSNVITVAAADMNSMLPEFSNHGTSHVNIAAPGVDIGLLWKDGEVAGTIHGTSPAAALVSGQLAYIFAKHPSFDNTAAIQMLYDSASVESELIDYVNGGRILRGVLEDYFAQDVSAPVELSYFNGQILGNKVLLEWETLSEVNNGHFDIERSFDGQTYEAIGKIMGHGNSTIPRPYSFTDHSPQMGNNYYRLRQVDFNGDYEYSHIIVLSVDNQLQMTIHPNPITGNASIIISNTDVEQVQIIIYSLQGTIVHEAFIDVARGKVEGLDFEYLPKGMYVLTLNDGKRIISKHILVD